MTKRKHKNTTRLTARERAGKWLRAWLGYAPTELDLSSLTRAFGAHTRQALARNDRRARDNNIVHAGLGLPVPTKRNDRRGKTGR
jgi:hypothetical protein